MARRPRSTASSPLQFLASWRWPIVGAAFLAGLLLFVVVWLRVREPAPEDARVQPVAMQAPAAPLPAPAPAGARAPLPAPEESAQLVEAVPAEPPAPAEPAPLPASIEEDTAAAPAPQPPPAAPGVAVQPPQRLPGQAAPRYPPAALRRGETGTVVVSVQVDAEGRPAAVEVSQRSGSFELDRAALEAVSRWRFEPARDASGQPVPGSIQVPFDFKTE